MFRKWVSFFVFLAIGCAHGFAGNREQELVGHVKRCLDLAQQQKSLLSEEVLNIPGMSGRKMKCFLNNLCSLPHASYLEVGCWKGSTLVAALYRNQASIQYAVAVDNWSEFGGTKEEFLRNIGKFLPGGQLHFFEQDCFSMDKQASFPIPVNVYFYDGAHAAWDQERAFTFFDDVFEDVFIAVVDDWNWDFVREGTFTGFKKLNYEILFDRAIYTGWNGDAAGWWNGVYIAVIKKPAS